MDTGAILAVLNFFKNLYQRTSEYVKDHPGPSLLAMVVVVAASSALALVDTGGDAGTVPGPPASPLHGAQIGGIDVQGYCDSITYEAGTLDVSDPNDPRVVCFTPMAQESDSSTGPISISLIGACARHYDLGQGQNFSFVYDDPADLNSGICYREPGHELLGGMNDLSGYCKAQYRNMSNVKARSDLMLQGRKIWSCSVTVDASTVCIAQHPGYEDVVPLQEEGELACYTRRKR